MRRTPIFAATAFSVLTLVGGCRREMIPDPPAAVSRTTRPTPPDLVAYLNHNAQLVQSIKCTQLEIQAKQGNDSIGLQGTLFCQKPRDFRLRGTVAGQPAVDIGSNNQEFWFWISQAKDDDGVPASTTVPTGTWRPAARMPFPFQPDMITAALGMGYYDPQKEYTIAKTPDGSLVEKATSAQGQPVQKVTQFNKLTVGPNKPQVLAYYLLDDRGNEICRATVLDVQTVKIGGQPAVIPKHVKLVWRTQQIEMSMRLFDTEVNKINAPLAAKLFSRAGLSTSRRPTSPVARIRRAACPRRCRFNAHG